MQPKRYAYLDGIRGIAAIFVLTRHTDGFWNFSLFRSYLAVDLFFILSGFVIAYAYEIKIREGMISFRDFVAIRIIRLYPIYLLSLIICSAIYIWINISKNKFGILEIQETITMIALTAAFLPSTMPGSSALFPLNTPYWSLFFELIANFIYAKSKGNFDKKTILIFVIFFGSIVSLVSFTNGNLNIGFTWEIYSVIAGFSRAMFGIFFGVLIYRNITFFARYTSNSALPFFAIFIVCLVLISPSAGNFDFIIDIISVTIIFPICVIFASQDANKRIDFFLLGLGSASYPLYVLHQPAGELLSYAMKGLQLNYAPYSGIAFVLFLVLTSIYIEKIYDLPLRGWLTKQAFKYKKRHL